MNNKTFINCLEKQCELRYPNHKLNYDHYKYKKHFLLIKNVLDNSSNVQNMLVVFSEYGEKPLILPGVNISHSCELGCKQKQISCNISFNEYNKSVNKLFKFMDKCEYIKELYELYRSIGNQI
jgi:hypothetical protein